MAEKYPGWSPYNYTLNNPIKYVDPTGMLVENGQGPTDHRKLDEDGNAILIDTEGETIYLDGKDISEYDFTGKEKAFSQINEYYGEQAGIPEDAIYPFISYLNGKYCDSNQPLDWQYESPSTASAKPYVYEGEGQGVFSTLWDGRVYDKNTYASKSNL